MSLPFEGKASAIPNILLISVAILGIFLLKKGDLKKTILQKKGILTYVALVVLITFISMFNKDVIRDLSFVGKLLIPMIMIVLASKVKNFEVVKKYFIASVFFGVLISTYNILGYFIGTGEFKFSKGNFINEILISERLYIGFASVISIIFTLDIVKSLNNKPEQKVLLIFNVIFLYSFLLLSVSRIAIITSTLVIGYFILVNIKRGKRNMILGLFAILTLLFFLFNSNLTKRFLHLDDNYRSSIIEKIKVHEPRYDIWKCSFKVLWGEKNFFFGNGYSKTKELLVECYKDEITVEKRKAWFMERKFNSHNQFLDFLLTYGVFAMAILVSMIYLLFKSGESTFLGNSLLIALILIMSVENIFHRQLGCYLFALVFISILSIKENKIKQNEY